MDEEVLRRGELGDHAAAPYGPRAEEDIYRLTMRGVERLFEQDCRLVVLACNTAAAVALQLGISARAV